MCMLVPARLIDALWDDYENRSSNFTMQPKNDNCCVCMTYTYCSYKNPLMPASFDVRLELLSYTDRLISTAHCVCVLHIKPFFYSSTSSTPSVRTDSSP